MCTVNISVDESVIRNYNPALSSREAIQQWLQRQVDIMLKELSPSDTKPPCCYTDEEVRQMVTDRLDLYDAGLAKTVSLEEFEKHMKSQLV